MGSIYDTGIAQVYRKGESGPRRREMILAIGLTKIAARCVYYAAFHAAEAYIFERTGQIAKTHSGLRSVLTRLTNVRLEIDRSFRTFLARTYKYKEISDYDPGMEAVVTPAEADGLIITAQHYIEAISILLDGPSKLGK